MDYNMRPISLLAIICALAFAGCASREHAASPRQILEDGAWNETPTAENVIKQHTGIDYRKAVEAAVRKDPAGLHQLFLFTDSDWFIGALADDHCHTLKLLLYLWGDRPFSAALARETPRIRRAVISALDYDGTEYDRYPLTNAAAPHPYGQSQ